MFTVYDKVSGTILLGVDIRFRSMTGWPDVHIEWVKISAGW